MTLLRAGRRCVASLCATVALLTAGAIAQAAVAVDSSSNASDNSQTLQWTHTVGPGLDHLLVVGVSLRGGETVTGITYSGQSLTLLGARSNSGNHIRAEIWYLVAPPVGTGSVTVNLSGRAQFVSGAVSFTGVLQTSPLGPFFSNASTGQGLTDPTLTMTSATGEVALDVLSVEGGSQFPIAGAGQTEIWNAAFGGPITGASSTQPGAAGLTTSWSKAKKGRWAIGATSIRPAVVAELTLTKAVDAATARPGEVLTYTLVHSNTGPLKVFPTFTTDPIPADTEYQMGSAVFLPGTSGITASIEFSDDGGASYGYPPLSGGGGAPAGFDANVTHVRYTFSGTLSSSAPDNTFTVQFGVRIR